MSSPALFVGAANDATESQSLWNLLGISAEAPPAERIRLLLRQLEHADYLPPPAWHEAIEILAGRAASESRMANISFPALRQETEERLRHEIDQFVDRFFTLSADERESEWNELRRRTEHWPTFRARLKLLEPGLGIELVAVDASQNSRVTNLVHSIARLFPLGAAARRRLIGELLVPMRGDPHQWESSAFSLARSHPELTRIVPEFLIAVTSLCDPERKEARVRAALARATAYEAEYESADWGDFPCGRQWNRIYRGMWVVVLAVFVLIVLAAWLSASPVNQSIRSGEIPREVPWTPQHESRSNNRSGSPPQVHKSPPSERPKKSP